MNILKPPKPELPDLTYAVRFRDMRNADMGTGSVAGKLRIAPVPTPGKCKFRLGKGGVPE